MRGLIELNEYIGTYSKPFVQIYIKRIFANTQGEAEEIFIKYIEKDNEEKYSGWITQDVYVELISDLEFVK
jgi:hypothetical protein